MSVSNHPKIVVLIQMYTVPSGICSLLAVRVFPGFPAMRTRTHFLQNVLDCRFWNKIVWIKKKPPTNLFKTIVDLRKDEKIKTTTYSILIEWLLLFGPVIKFVVIYYGKFEAHWRSSEIVWNGPCGRRLQRLIFCRPTLYSVTGYRVPDTTIRWADVLNLERTLAGGKTTQCPPRWSPGLGARRKK